MKISVLLLIITLSYDGVSSPDCLSAYPESGYYRALASAETEEAARAEATRLLMTAFPSRISIRRQQRSVDLNGSVDQAFQTDTEILSQLRLMGLQYFKCPGKRRAGRVSVVAYISRQDLERSAEQTATKVREYTNLMSEQKENYYQHALLAYYHAHLSPHTISGVVDGNTRSDVQAYLESVLREYLARLTVHCTGVSAQPGYEGQLNIHLGISGGAPGLGLQVSIPAYSSGGRLTSSMGSIGAIVQPLHRSERIKAIIALEPLVLPEELIEVSAVARITREITLDVDFAAVIRIAINRTDNGFNWLYQFESTGIAIQQWEWFVNDQLRSVQPTITVSKSEDLKSIRLRLNGDDGLTAAIGEPQGQYAVPGQNNPDLPRVKDPKPAGRTSASEKSDVERTKLSEAPAAILKLAMETSGKNLESSLSEMVRQGILTAGRKSDFLNPDRCWVLIASKMSGTLYMLTPERNGRTDLRSSHVFANFETELRSELSGNAVLWLEVYP